MAGKFKVDLSGVQQFFIDRGDKIALGLCVLAAGLLITMGVLDAASVRTAPNSTKPYAQTMQSAAIALGLKVDQAPPNEEVIAAHVFKPVPWQWPFSDLRFPFAKFFDKGDSGSTKRLNPKVVSVLTGDDSIAMWYVPGCYFAHDVSKQKQQIVVYQPAANGNNPQPVLGPKKNVQFQGQPAIITRPMRMVVVNAKFPMTEQLVEFQNAFRMQNQAELFASKDLPRVLGINIWRTDLSKPNENKPLVVATVDPKTGETTIEVDESIRKLFREALLDEDNLALYSPFLLQGMTMPLPRLAILPNGQYPPLKFPWLEIDPDGPQMEGPRGGAMGGMGSGRGGAGGAGGRPFNPFGAQGGAAGAMGGMGKDLERDDVFPWKGLNKDLQDKLNDRTEILDPQLVKFDPEEEKDKKDAEPNPRGQNMLEGFFQGNSIFSSQAFWARFPKPPMPAGTGGKEAKNLAAVGKPHDALVRFVDPTVEPGKTYKYTIQVRMANPNFGKKEDVAFPALAEIKELFPSQPVDTPTITIPGEYYLYAVNQQPEHKVLRGSDWDAPKEKDPYKPEHVAVQIHRWVDEAKQSGSRDQAIGDWCIAERIFLRRGDPVGREVNIEIPTWNSEENRFQLGKAVGNAGAPNPKAPPQMPVRGKGPAMMPPPQAAATGGIPIQFAVTTPPPVLVDFDGGKRELRLGVGPNSSGTAYRDESASNLLILRADGTLIVRNTRVDSEVSSQQGKDRVERIETWKAKTLPFRNANNPNGMPFRPNGPGTLFGKGG
jgi:hypothetical protein